MWLGAAGIAIGPVALPMLPRRNGDCNYVEDRMPCKAPPLTTGDRRWVRQHIDPPPAIPFNWKLSLALDACIIALEASSGPVGRSTFRQLKRQLEGGIREVR